MKRIVYTLTLALALLAISTPSQAQKKNNWFVGTGIGCNFMYDNLRFSSPTPAGQLYVGDWFNPSVGFRTAIHGLMGKPADPQDNWFSEDTVFGLFQLHLDGMWAFMNSFTHYNINRYWNPSLYLRVSGLLATSLGNNVASFGVGAGWLNQFRVSDFMSIAIDLNAIVANEKPFRSNYDHFTPAIFGSATVGVVFDLGHRGF